MREEGHGPSPKGKKKEVTLKSGRIGKNVPM